MTIFSLAEIFWQPIKKKSDREKIKPFKNNNKQSQGHLGEGGPLSIRTGKIVHHITNTALTSTKSQLALTHMNAIPN